MARRLLIHSVVTLLASCIGLVAPYAALADDRQCSLHLFTGGQTAETPAVELGRTDIAESELEADFGYPLPSREVSSPIEASQIHLETKALSPRRSKRLRKRARDYFQEATGFCKVKSAEVLGKKIPIKIYSKMNAEAAGRYIALPFVALGETAATVVTLGGYFWFFNELGVPFPFTQLTNPFPIDAQGFPFVPLYGDETCADHAQFLAQSRKVRASFYCGWEW